MMVVFFHASRLALLKFDPYLGSRPLAQALLKAPAGQLILNGEYFLSLPFSSTPGVPRYS